MVANQTARRPGDGTAASTFHHFPDEDTTMSGYDELEDDDQDHGPEEQDGLLSVREDGTRRDRCLFPGECIASDPWHGPEECWTAEHVEAYEAELAHRDLGAGDA